LVTIDERDEGMYLVFKDAETRRPRYELLAIPHEANSDNNCAYIRPPNALAYISEGANEGGAFATTLNPPPINVASDKLASGISAVVRTRHRAGIASIELIFEGLQLIHVVLALISLAAGVLLIGVEISVGRILELKGDKSTKEVRKLSSTPQSPPTATPAPEPLIPSLLLAMNDPHPPLPDDLPFVDVPLHSDLEHDATPQDEVSEGTQKLSRQRFGQFGAADDCELAPTTLTLRNTPLTASGQRTAKAQPSKCAPVSSPPPRLSTSAPTTMRIKKLTMG
jgi:hypothetical protein